jgi:uncharacterized protein (TIGR02246 family)
MKISLRTLLLIVSLLAPVAAAEDPAHEELRKLRTDIIAGITAGDIESVLQHVDPQVVITWQNSEVCRGRDGLKAFFEKTGKESFKGYKVPPTPDGLTLLQGGTHGISVGETIAGYKLFGKDYEIKSRWTATVVKTDGQWRLAAYHISMNVLDNPLLDAAKKGIAIAAGVALVVGSAIGYGVAKRRKG